MICYHDMLRTEIREHLSILSDKTLPSLVEAAREIVLELETQQQKRRQDHVHASPTIARKARVPIFRQDIETLMNFVGVEVRLIGVFVVCFFRDVLGVFRRVTVVGSVV